jgi:16S rRNA processing protein RimM
VTIGRIAAPHGLRGEVRATLETDFPERFDGLRDAWLVRGDHVEPITITGRRPHRGGVLLTLAGVGDVEAAAGLRGAEIAVPRDAVVPLAEGQFYIFEIIGLRVLTAAGQELGRVAEVLRGPVHDVYVVRGEAGDTLVPALRDVVRQIDRASGEIVVDLPSGLETPERAY